MSVQLLISEGGRKWRVVIIFCCEIKIFLSLLACQTRKKKGINKHRGKTKNPEKTQYTRDRNSSVSTTCTFDWSKIPDTVVTRLQSIEQKLCHRFTVAFFPTQQNS